MREALLKEITLKTSRSSGPGGQHVNKTESRVELHWKPGESNVLTEEQKQIVMSRLGKRLTTGGVLIMASQASRSQLKNRETVQNRFLDLIEKSLRKPRRRIRTRPSRKSNEKRLKEKKIASEKKQRRRRDF